MTLMSPYNQAQPNTRLTIENGFRRLKSLFHYSLTFSGIFLLVMFTIFGVVTILEETNKEAIEILFRIFGIGLGCVGLIFFIFIWQTMRALEGAQYDALKKLLLLQDWVKSVTFNDFLYLIFLSSMDYILGEWFIVYCGQWGIAKEFVDLIFLNTFLGITLGACSNVIFGTTFIKNYSNFRFNLEKLYKIISREEKQNHPMLSKIPDDFDDEDARKSFIVYLNSQQPILSLFEKYKKAEDVNDFIEDHFAKCTRPVQILFYLYILFRRTSPTLTDNDRTFLSKMTYDLFQSSFVNIPTNLVDLWKETSNPIYKKFYAVCFILISGLKFVSNLLQNNIIPYIIGVLGILVYTWFYKESIQPHLGISGKKKKKEG